MSVISHYICTGGCKGVSEQSVNCGAEACEKKGQPLTPCDCADMKHGGALKEQARGELAAKSEE